MASFLDRLNEKLNDSATAHPADGAGKAGGNVKIAVAPAGPELLSRQLDVDVYSCPQAVIIFAQLPGADPGNVSATLDPDGDTIVITGERKRPVIWGGSDRKELLDSGKWVQTECKWEKFYRKIILPAEVDVTAMQAYTQYGVLILHLPTLKLAGGRTIPISEDSITQPPVNKNAS
jgi:HSP20 family molecular chaperone IbpA